MSDFTITPMCGDPSNGWLDVEFKSDGHVALAELQSHFDDNEFTVWGVKVVDETQRGRGIGTALMTRLASHADAQRWDLRLLCETLLIGFYERFGFEVTGRGRHVEMTRRHA